MNNNHQPNSLGDYAKSIEHDEQQIAYRLKHRLDQSLDHIDALTLNKLMQARQRALAHQKVALTVTRLSLAGIGQTIQQGFLPYARALLTLLVLTGGVLGSYYWNNLQQAEENEEIDSALLADDLPINAYLDHGFHTWLEHPHFASDTALPQE